MWPGGGLANWISRYADLRALGAVMYRMLTGYPPIFREARSIGLVDSSGCFDGAAYIDLKELVAAVEPVPVGDLVRDMPQELDMLIQPGCGLIRRSAGPGNPATMPERVWEELVAVADQVGNSGDLVGPGMAREPDFRELRAQWHGRHAGRTNRAGSQH
jgi:hypothetical protein